MTSFKSEIPIEFSPAQGDAEAYPHLFRRKQRHLNWTLNKRELHNSFVTHYGLVLNSLGMLHLGCAPNLKLGPDDNYFIPHIWKAWRQWYGSKKGKSLKLKRLSKHRTYLLIYSPWFSNYFWITECLPRLLAFKDDFPHLTLLYPEYWKNYSYVNESLDLFPELEREVIPDDVHMVVPNLVFQDVKPFSNAFIPEQMQMVRELFQDWLQKGSRAEKILISRAKARRQFVDNEQIESIFKEHGYQSVVYEDMSFRQQIELSSRASNLAGITGAGHVNALWMQAGGSFLDFTNEAYLKNRRYKFHFYDLACINQVQYKLFLCPHEGKPGVDHVGNQNLVPNRQALHAFLE